MEQIKNEKAAMSSRFDPGTIQGLGAPQLERGPFDSTSRHAPCCRCLPEAVVADIYFQILAVHWIKLRSIVAVAGERESG